MGNLNRNSLEKEHSEVEWLIKGASPCKGFFMKIYDFHREHHSQKNTSLERGDMEYGDEESRSLAQGYPDILF